MHEVFHKPPWVVCPGRTSIYWALHQLQYLRKGHHICLQSYSYYIYPMLCVRTIPCDLTIWQQREDADIAPLNYTKLTLVLFCSLKVAPSPVATLLYAASPCWPQMNPRANTIDLFLSRFVWNLNLLNILNMAVRVVCNQIGFCPAIWPFSTQKRMLLLPSDHPKLWCAYWGQ